MTVDSGIDRLLKDVLALQDEDGRGAELTEERVRHVLLGRDTFKADERSLLATSPLARLTYAEITEDLRLEREAFEQGSHEEAVQQSPSKGRAGDGTAVATRVIALRRLQVAASFIALAIAIGYVLSRLGPYSRQVESQSVDAELSDKATSTIGATGIFDKAINTAGEKGAYHTAFCPPLPGALANAYLQGYKCTPSKGTLENIDRVLRNPTSIGFVQLDVYADEAIKRADEFKKLTVIRSDIACEGLWMVTKDPELKNYGHIQAFSQRINFILPVRESGSAPTFDFLQENDPDGLGRVPEDHKRYVADATEVLNETAASTNGAVGFFVQFADPGNANIKLIADKGLKVIPVVTKEILDKKLNGQHIYQLQTFTLKSGGIFAKTTEATAACTPVAIITGAPEAFRSDRDKVDDQRGLIQAIRNIPAERLLPKENPIVADVIRFPKTLADRAVIEMVAMVEKTRQISEKALQ
jgi:hypothetical protein